MLTKFFATTTTPVVSQKCVFAGVTNWDVPFPIWLTRQGRWLSHAKLQDFSVNDIVLAPRWYLAPEESVVPVWRFGDALPANQQAPPQPQLAPPPPPVPPPIPPALPPAQLARGSADWRGGRGGGRAGGRGARIQSCTVT